MDRYEELVRKRDSAGLNAEEAAELGRLTAERRETPYADASHPPPPAPTTPYRPIRGFGTALVWLLGAAAALDLIAALSDLAEIRLLDRARAGLPITFEEATANDARQGAIGLLQLLIFLATGVVFIVWLHRAYSNLPALGATRLRFGKGWAIGGWMVPIWNLFRPKQIVNDAWRGSDPALPASYEVTWTERPVPAWWQVWWLPFLVSGYLGVASFRVGMDTLQELRLGSLLWFWSDLLSGGAGIVGVFIVRAITARQEERARQILSIPAPPR